MRPFRILCLLVCMVALLAISDLGAGAARRSQQEGVGAPVEPALLEALDREGQANFLVFMAAKADLSAALAMGDWSARGWYVYQRLREVAEQSQSPVLAYAQKNDLEIRSFFGVNAVYVRGGSQEAVQELAALPGVERLALENISTIQPAEGPAGERVAAYGWNLDNLDPALGLYGMQAVQVWDRYGVRGEGIVVGSIDTGAYYQHEALESQYRGRLGAGYFDHNFNWWDPTGTYPNAPADGHGHGSGSLGLIVGGTPDLVEQIGVAPAGRWMACKGCDDTGACPDSATFSCGDFMLAPWDLSGAAPNPDLRPHIVNNSWGSSGCKRFYQAYIQAWVAAGIFPAWSAGNTAACGGVGSPGDNPEAFGTAAHDASGENQYAGGPSCFFTNPSCDPEAHQVDPHLNAPTFARTSGNEPGEYYTLAGTSGASPHTAGTVALIWSANPSYIGNVYGTFTVLEQSANRQVPPGSCGQPACASGNVPNYEYGWGYLDALSAVTRAGVGGQGSLEGHLTEASSLEAPGDPLSAITVRAERMGGGFWETLSDASAYYTLTLRHGTYTVTAEGDFHTTQTLPGIEVVTGTHQVQDISLLPKGLLFGALRDADSGVPLAGRVIVSGVGTAETVGDSGVYYLYLDAGHYEGLVEAAGHFSQILSLSIGAGEPLEANFELVGMVAQIPNPIRGTVKLYQSAKVGAVITNNMVLDYPFVFTELAVPGEGSGSGELGNTRVLLMGENVSAVGWQSYRDALAAAGAAWDEWNLDSQPFPGLADLSAYSVLVWFDASALSQGDPECQVVADWLGSGGKSLFAIGIDFLWDLENGSPGQGEHNLYQLFHTRYLGNAAGVGIRRMAGVSGDLVGDGLSLALSADLNSSGDYADPQTSAASAGLVYGPGGVGGGYAGLTYYEDPGYSIAWLGINFHSGLTEAAERNALMSRVMDLLVGGDVLWYGTDVVSGTVRPGAGLKWTNSFSAFPARGIDQPGEYRARLRVRPAWAHGGLPALEVPVIMQVLPAADMGKLAGLVRSDRPGAPLQAEILLESASGVTVALESDPQTGYFQYWLLAGEYQLTVQADDYLSETIPVLLTAGVTTSLNLELDLLAPSIAVAPLSLSEHTPWGQTITRSLQIENSGIRPLTYQISEAEVGFCPLGGGCEEVYGSTISSWSASRRDRGNIFEATEDTIISEIRVYLDLGGATDLYFVIYRGEAVQGSFEKIYQGWLEQVGPGEGWISSGTIAVEAEAGRFYYVGASWNGVATYYRGVEQTPLPTQCFGILHTGVPENLAGYPPAPAGYNSASGFSPYHFALVTGGSDVPWLSTDVLSGTVLPGAAAELAVSLEAGRVAEPGDYRADLRILHDDPLNDILVVPVSMSVEALDTWGKVEGRISDSCTDQPVPGAQLLIEGGSPISRTLSDLEGHYYAWLEAGTYSVTLSHPDYASQTLQLEVIAQQSRAQDEVIVPDRPCISVAPAIVQSWLISPTELFTHPTGIEISNLGFQALEYEIVERYGGYASLPVAEQAPWSWEEMISRNADSVSLERAPAPAGPEGLLPISPGGSMGGRPAYGVNLMNDSLYHWADLELPGSWSLVGAFPSTAFYAGDFAGEDFGLLYAIDNDQKMLHAIDTATGADTLIGPCTPYVGQIWTGMSWDPYNGVMLASATDGASATLFTVDLATGEATPLVPIAGAPFIIDIAVDPMGQIFGLDILFDALITVDRLTGHTTVIGPVNFDANYAQDLEFDEGVGILYLAAYNDTVSAGELRVADPATGSTTLVGAFPGGVEVDCLAIASAGLSDLAWLWELPVRGTVLPGATQRVDILFSSVVTGPLAIGSYTGALRIQNNDPMAGNQWAEAVMHVVDEYIRPTALFAARTPVLAGEPMYFKNYSDPGIPWDTIYTWYFGDGMTSTLKYPSHVYPGWGVFTVTLEACNGAGCDDYSNTVQVLPRLDFLPLILEDH